MVEVTEIRHHSVSVPSRLLCVSLNTHGPAALDTTTLAHLLCQWPPQPNPNHLCMNPLTMTEPCLAVVQYYIV